MPEFVVAFEESFDNLDAWVVNSTKTGSANGYPGGPAQFGTDEIETVTDDPTNLVADGRLRITPTRVGDRWFSARIETARVFKPAKGSIMRVEARLQLPNVHGPEAAGYWPAFWMMGSSQRDARWEWPACGEFDIAESVNGVNRNWSTLHGGPASSWGGPFGEPSGFSNRGVAPAEGDIWGEFHLFSFEWDRTTSTDELRWYLDGAQVWSAKPGVISPGDWANMSGHPGYFIIVNCAMGGQFPAALGGGPNVTTRPGAPLVVDFVRVSYAGSEAPEAASGNDGRGTGSPPPVDPGPVDPPTDPDVPPVVDPPVDPPATGAPTNLRVTGSSINSVTLAWDGGQADVLRSGVKIADGNGTFTDRGLAQHVPYLYSVRAAGVTTPQITVTLPVDAPVDPPPVVVYPQPEAKHYRIDLTIPVTGDPIITIT